MKETQLSLYRCSFVTQFQLCRVAQRQPRVGGALCSSQVSTLMVFHQIFNSKDRRLGLTERVLGMKDRGWRGILGGRQRRKDDVLQFSLLLIIYTSHFFRVCVVYFCSDAPIFSRLQSFSEMSLQSKASIHASH